MPGTIELQGWQRLHLPDYPYKSNYIQVYKTELHYIDEGERKNPIILFLHGVPTWSFTFRKIFPVCLKAGNRIIAPDLPGFGFSEKPADRSFYTLQKMIGFIEHFIKKLKIENIFLYGQDWGAIIGMVLAAQKPHLFKGLIVCNGALPGINQKLPFPLYLWKWFTVLSPYLPVAKIVGLGTIRKLTKSEKKGYRIPYSGQKGKFALRILPQQIPFRNSDRNLAEDSWRKLEMLQLPFLTIFSDRDPVTRNGEKWIIEKIPGAKNQPHKKIGGGHFLHEDAPVELSLMINKFVKDNA